MDKLPRLGKRELICLLLFACNYVVSVWRGFLFLWVLGMGYVILLWHSLSLPYNYSERFNQLGWSTNANRHNYNKAVLTYKAGNDLTPEYISNLLKPIFETHNRNLRSATNGSLSVPRSRTSLFDRSFSATAAKLWNLLPKEINTASSLENFKQSAKTHFMNR